MNVNSKVNKTLISVVVPCHNEEENLAVLFQRLELVLDQLDTESEIICVNDGSRDRTLEFLVRHHARNQNIKVINLSRNFGKEIALTAGIDYASGDVVVPIDADLQDPPELIKTFMEKWREGYDVVYGTRISRQGETWFKRFTADMFYRVIDRMSLVYIPRNTGDFRLMDRMVVEALKQMPERNRFMKGLFAWVGFKQVAVEYNRESRNSGTTTWNYWKLWNFALDGITAFSLIPLKVWSYLGFSISFLSFIYGIFLIIRTLIFGVDIPGYASMMVVMLLGLGIQLLILGIIGEYLGRVYQEVKQRPLYFVRDIYDKKKES